MWKSVQEIIQYRELLFNLVVNELKLRYRNSILGFLWTIINPLFYLLILAAVFSRLIRFQIENYTLFLFTGLVSWLMIQQTVLTATASIVNNQNMIKKVYVPKLIFPLSNVLARFVDHFIMTLILLGFMLILHAPVTWNLLWLPLIFLMHFLFSLGLSLICAVAYIKIRDVQHIVSILFQALFYLTPILYAVEILPVGYRNLFYINPFYYFVQCFRFPIYAGQAPPPRIFAAAMGLTLAVSLSGFALFLRKQRKFVFHLS